MSGNATADCDVLLLPGMGGSGDDHWQSIWERGATRYHIVAQADWDAPDRDAWLVVLDAEIAQRTRPFVLVAHSLGCALAAHWVAAYCVGARRKLRPEPAGIMMVAPADVDSPERTPEHVRSFAPMPLTQLPGSSVVVASEDDPYVTIERARYFAAKWNSRFISIGERGHVNAGSGLGDWPEGRHLLGSISNDSQ